MSDMNPLEGTLIVINARLGKLSEEITTISRDHMMIMDLLAGISRTVREQTDISASLVEKVTKCLEQSRK